MNSPIPAPIAIPLIAFVAVVVLGRRIVLHHAIVDRLLNRAMLWGTATLVLLERGFAPAIGSLLHQLSMATLLMEVAGLYGAARLWSGADPVSASARQRVYDLAGLAGGAIILAVGSPARQEGRLLGQAADWPTAVVWSILWLPLFAAGRLAWRAALRELRSDESTPAERIVYATLLATLVAGSAGLVVSAVRLATPGPAADPALARWAAPTFAASTLGAALLAVPLIAWLRAHTGWDRAGRYCRRLRPLWRDLTAAVPEVVLEPDIHLNGSEARLVRMTVEIRDALMHLRHYLPAETSDADYAEQVMRAIAAKTNGAAVTPRPLDQPVRLPAGDIHSDLRLLLALARRWPADGVSTKISGHPAGEPNARRSGDGWFPFRQARRIRP
ncbi:MAB_1171c family putative transporter [Nocardia araoensis]|uniref:MAB_1171c family putative transporter n=1 Tax=Nocardia araoensis TaxID=228600 RepID=UPI0002E31626|nr:MAB_1171c family putative transporter [Nocardia araoensis]